MSVKTIAVPSRTNNSAAAVRGPLPVGGGGDKRRFARKPC
jgi:hypothetical protein